MDYEASEIRFSGMHDGNTFTGTFGNWDASILFDASAPEDAQVEVTVATGSANANQKLYTDSLKSPEWFNVANFPSASVEIVGITSTGDQRYTSTARLTLKETMIETPFDFELSIDGDAARMTGQAVLQRKPLNLGQQSDPNADWVSEDVTVDVIVEATRTN